MVSKDVSTLVAGPSDLAMFRLLPENGFSSNRCPSIGTPGPPGLSPPRFTLHHVFLWITTLCGTLAILSCLSTVYLLSFWLFIPLILAHVVGNKLGTEMRDRTSQFLTQATTKETQRTLVRSPRVPVGRPSGSVGFTTHLQKRDSIFAACRKPAAVGALLSGLLGGTLLLLTQSNQITLAGITLGSLSSAILGSFLGFLAGSFWGVVREAWKEAVRGP